MINKYITNLAHALAKIPTISKKNAENIAFFILENREIGDLIQESLTGALSSIKLCSLCNNFAQEEICRICKRKICKICKADERCKRCSRLKICKK